ncbi:MAG: hypothetical protein NXI00_23305 [Cytophagales bacterium]|nr:hypothetical protein [Cytophagales bacterium]
MPSTDDDEMVYRKLKRDDLVVEDTNSRENVLFSCVLYPFFLPLLLTVSFVALKA